MTPVLALVWRHELSCVTNGLNLQLTDHLLNMKHGLSNVHSL